MRNIFRTFVKTQAMKKDKLCLIRKEKGYTQKQLAEIIATDVSNYSRKENGEVKIIKEEWQKMAKFLNVPLDDIYENDDSIAIRENDKIPEVKINKESTYLSIIVNLQEYISILKEENARLKKNLP